MTLNIYERCSMKVDMSPQAISKRFKQCSELRRLCIALAGPRAKKQEPEQPSLLSGTKPIPPAKTSAS